MYKRRASYILKYVPRSAEDNCTGNFIATELPLLFMEEQLRAMAIKRMKDSHNFVRLNLEYFGDRLQEERDPDKVKQITMVCDEVYEKLEKFQKELDAKPLRFPEVEWLTKK